MTEFEKATRWREELNLSPVELAKALGYSPSAIYWFERGETPPNRNSKSGSKSRDIKPWVWLRYKRACAGLDAEIKSRKKFGW